MSGTKGSEMPKKPEPAVARYLAELPDEIGQIASRVRHIVLGSAAGITEELKWGTPWFSKNGRLCYLMANQEHVTFGFAKGASLNNPDRILEGTGKSSATSSSAPSPTFAPDSSRYGYARRFN